MGGGWMTGSEDSETPIVRCSGWMVKKRVNL
jgi:hypothetical protein